MVILKKIVKSPLTFLLLLFISALKPLFQTGVWASSDLLQHIGRLSSFYQSLSEGNIIPRWAGNMYYGYGYPILMAYYPLVNYLGSFFHFMGLSFVNSLHGVFILAYILSGVLMYLWLKEWLKTKPAILGVILFQFAPYRFVNIYSRAAVGEHFSYLFIPLCFWMIFKLCKHKTTKHLILTALSLAGLIAAHNLMFGFMLPLFGLYAVYLLISETDLKSRFKLMSLIIFSLILAISLTAFFWLPVVGEVLKYTEIVNKNPIARFQNHYLTLGQLIYSVWGYGGTASLHQLSPSTAMIGVSHWLIVLITIGFLLRKWKDKKGEFFLMLTLVLSFLGSILLMLKVTSFLVKPLTFLFGLVQFPGRFRSISVVTSVILGALLASVLKKRKQMKFVLLLSLLTIGLTTSYWRVNYWLPERDYSDNYWLSNYPFSGDVGECKPIWIWNKTSPAKNKVEAGIGVIEEIRFRTWQFEKHAYSLTVKSDSIIVDNTAFFPGWKVYVDGGKVPIQFQDTRWAGLITYSVPKGTHEIQVVFRETKLRLLADLISLGSLMLLLWLGVFRKNLVTDWFKSRGKMKR